MNTQSQDRLLRMSALALLACFTVWWSFINTFNRAWAKGRGQIVELNASIEQANKCLKQAPAWTEDYKRALAKLAAEEKDMLPEGREMSFLSEAIERVRTNHPGVRFESISPAVNGPVAFMPQFIQFVKPGLTNLPVEWIVRGGRVARLPEFPYRWSATLGYKCIGYYHDFGFFLADLEDTYPYMQFQVISVAPVYPPEQRRPGELELRFELKVVALLRPSPPK